MKPHQKFVCLTVVGLLAGHLIQQWIQNSRDRCCRMAAGESIYERAQSRPSRKRKGSGSPACAPRRPVWVQIDIRRGESLSNRL